MNHPLVKVWRSGVKTIGLASLLISLFSSLIFPQVAVAANGRADYDLDDDGLIEINDLADLDAIRNNLNGTALYSENTGCPMGGCNGFELTADLDFDKNADGVVDITDGYWNGGKGWSPIGSTSTPFTSIFEGNGHVINNLLIIRHSSTYVGLFGHADNAEIRQLGLSGPLMSVTGGSFTGSLVGSLKDNNVITSCYSTGSIFSNGREAGGLVGHAGDGNQILSSHSMSSVTSTGSGYTGGLVGRLMTNNQITGSYSTGSVSTTARYAGGLLGHAGNDNQITASYSAGPVASTSSYLGGLVGYLERGNEITASYSTGSVIGESSYVGGLVGATSSRNDITASYSKGSVEGTSSVGGLIGSSRSTYPTNSYWAIDSSGQTTSSASSEGNSYVGLTLATLQCATAANTNSSNSSCVSADGTAEGLSNALTLYKNWDVSGYWDFGNNQQLPGLIFNGAVHRDSDDDGSLDEDDIWPYEPAASVDQDKDGYPDIWTLDCDASCITASGLFLDKFPNSVAAWQDDDLDGLVDAWAASCDADCQSASGLVLDSKLDDTDNDGLSNADDTYDNNANNDGLIDVDANSNGLIDISTLAQLDAIRHQLNGAGYRAINNAVLDQSGCPIVVYQGLEQQRCFGYELSNDLDFDSTPDGVINSADDYWNAGEGWSPIGSASPSNQFTAIFEGNGHVIYNLYINRPTTQYVGLFGYINHAEIRQLGLTGPLMSVTGRGDVGALVGHASSGNVLSANYTTGSVRGSYYNIGGLVGLADDSNKISDSYNTGTVKSSYNSVGGLVGSLRSNNQVTASYSSGYVNGPSAGGLLGGSQYTSIVTNSYWAIDSSGQATSSNSAESRSYVGLTLATLKCAIAANTNSTNSSCVSATGSDEGLSAAVTLFKDWQVSGYWDFGDDQQLPGLSLNGTVHRDSDGDGSLDANDDFPTQAASSLDQDQDGHPDSWTLGCDTRCIEASGLSFDQFPNSAAAWQDDDLDGLVDAWAVGCDAACQSASGLVLDIHLNDTDNDGSTNDIDDDDNGDGLIDIDADSNGLIEVSTLAQLNTIRYQLDGAGYRAAADGALDKSGCPKRLYQGREEQRCSGYELMSDLDFDSIKDGVIDGADDYWDGGKGWSPIGVSPSTPFTAIFNGNGHVINNLYINRPSTNGVGLFGSINNAEIRQIGLSGTLMSVAGRGYVGSLVGFASDNNIIKFSYSTGSVAGSQYNVGGLVGRIRDGNQISASYNTGAVTNSYYKVGGLIGAIGRNNSISSSYNTGSVIGLQKDVGGLIGTMDRDNQVSDSYSTGYVQGVAKVGGLIGYFPYYSSTITNSYWAVDSSGQTTSINSSESGGYVGLTLATLKCATIANTDSINSDCVSADGSAEGLSRALTLYKDWQVSGYWDFGTDQQLPGISLNGVVNRDSDGDGSLDANDAFPNEAAASVDQDQDGYPDRWVLGCDASCIELSRLIFDQFPNSAAAWQDDDLDGLVDAWADGCDVNCQNASGLVFDTHLNDTDNDGIANDNDIDDNNDGIANIDIDRDGLVEIGTLAQLNAIRYQLDGAGYRVASNGVLDQSGCPVVVYQGHEQQRCSGYELSNDLDFDSTPDGVIDAVDDYWDTGKGWSPIGDKQHPFTAIFEGNGQLINNLYIKRRTDHIGLFGYINNAQIRQVGLSGPLMSVTGNSHVGSLVGYANDNNLISASYNTGAVSSTYYYIGGLVGSININNEITASYNTGPVISRRWYSGGLVGSVGNENKISNSYSSGYVSSTERYAGGLIGSSPSSSLITNSYWAIDSSGQTSSDSSSESTGYVGLTLATLRCAIAANTDASNSRCVSADGTAENLSAALILYKDWQASGYWDFGNDQQLPGLSLNGAVYRDSDGDGSLDVNDAFYLNVAASIDNDGDSLPDVWSEYCDIQCQQASGLQIDPSLNDIDNDGVLDVNDADPSRDNGLPVLTAIVGDISLRVNSENARGALVTMDSDFMMAFEASDIVSTALIIQGTLNGKVLILDADNQVLLPAGNLDISWVAIDDAGNVSNSMIQNVKVYPQVHFTLVESVIGEATEALIEVELSGESPIYPVKIELEVDALSDVDQNDLSGSFDIVAKQFVIIEKGDDENVTNTLGTLMIPVIDDGVSENDEQLIVNLNGVVLDENEENFFTVDDAKKQHVLTVTDRNLAPIVHLLLEQNGIEVSSVEQGGGDVTVTAIITDANGKDTHTLVWDLNSLGLNVPHGNVLTFSPVNLVAGEYLIRIKVTDDGISSLSDSAELSLQVIGTGSNEDGSSNSKSGGSSGGGVLLWILVLLAGVAIQTRRRHVVD